MTTDTQRKNQKRKYQILSLLCGVVCLCCVVWGIAYLVGLKRAEAELEDIKGSYITQGSDETNQITGDADLADKLTETETPGENGSKEDPEASEKQEDSQEAPEETAAKPEYPDEYRISEKKVDFEALKAEVNGDIYAWITIPGTVIDYPVLQHPEEMDYYLEYNLDGTKGYPGCIYTQRMNSKDWTDPNTVLYGHNMKNGTMFGELHKFEDKDFFDENRYIHIYTEDGKILVYEIFGAYVYSNEHLLMSYPIYTDEGFQEYLDSIYSNTGAGCNFLTNRWLTSEDRIITLSTCIGNKPNNRYLVQGVLVEEVEQP